MPTYKAVRSAATFRKFVDKMLAEGKPIGFDIEAGYRGKDREGISLMQYHPDYVFVGFSFTNSEKWACYVPVAHDLGTNVDDVVSIARDLWRMLKSGLIVAHNASYELKGTSRFLRETLWNDPEYGEEIRETRGKFPIKSDTMIEAFLTQLYEPAQFGGGVGKDLKGLVKHIFGHQMVHFMDLFPKEDSDLGPATKKPSTARFNSRNADDPKVIDYGCEDALWCLALHYKHRPMMNGELATIYKTEMACLPIFVEMEDEGLKLDWNLVSEKAAEIQTFAQQMNEELLQEFSDRLGRVVNINLGSAKQVKELFYNSKEEGGLGLPVKGRSKVTNEPSTDAKTLEALAKIDPTIKRMLQYREVVKLYGSYLKKYETQLNYSDTGRAYPNHNQLGAATGRISVDQVSYQQWPWPYHYELKSGRTFDFSFKDLLVPPPGYRVMGFDFSQVELRFLAGMADETDMINAFVTGIDIHKQTAASMLHKNVEDVTVLERQIGKTTNFAVVYGSGPENLANMLTTPEHPMGKEEGIKILDDYYKAFPKLRGWMDARVVEGHEQGYVETIFGRKFYVWEYRDSRQFIRSKGDRMCVNAPIQGGAADYLKVGMVRLNKAIKKAGWFDKLKIIMHVHDALAFYVHNSLSDQEVIDLVDPAVSFPMNKVFPDYGTFPPIRTDWEVGPRYGSKAEIVLDENRQVVGYEHDHETYTDYAEVEKILIEETAKRIRPWEPPLPADMEPGDWGTYPGEDPADAYEATFDEPMALTGEEAKDDEPEWAHIKPGQWDITLVDMPTVAGFKEFKDFLKNNPGKDRVVLHTPQGEAPLKETYHLVATDQHQISLLLGGASINFRPLDADLLESM